MSLLAQLERRLLQLERTIERFEDRLLAERTRSPGDNCASMSGGASARGAAANQPVYDEQAFYITHFMK